MIFIRFLRSTFSAQKKLIIYVIISTAAALFCVNVMYGFTMQRYYSSYDATWYTTIAVIDPDETGMDDIAGYIADRYSKTIGSALYIMKQDEHRYIVGWQGSDKPSMWFPEAGGRFFTPQELEEGENVAYIHFSEKSALETDSIEIGGEVYSVVGCGFIETYNFLSPIGKGSGQSIFQNPSGQNIDSDETDLFRIIPYKNMVDRGYRPQIVLIHPADITREELEKLAGEIKKDIPGIKLTIPDSNPNKDLEKEQSRTIPFAALFAIVIIVSVGGIIQELLGTLRDNIKVFCICGISKVRMILYLCGLLLLMFLIAEVIALGLQGALREPLSYLQAGRMPPVKGAMLVFIALYAITVATSMKNVTSYTSTERENIL